MDVNVQVGSWYIVEGDAGDTVTNPENGKAIATVEDGKQATFYATTPYVITSADTVGVHKATFNSAPAKLKALGLLGGGTSTGLPAGFFECWYLQSGGTQYVDTGVVMTADTGLKMTYCSPSSGRMAFGVKKAEGDIQGSFYSIHCYTATGGAQHHWLEYGWGNQRYPLNGTGQPPQRALPGEVQHCTLNWNNDGKWDWVCDRRDGSITHLSGDIANKNTYTPPALNIFLWKINNNGTTLDLSTTAKARVFSAQIEQGNKVVCDMVPAISKDGRPCMVDKVSKQAFFNAGTGNFSIAFTMKNMRNLRHLTATSGGSISVSLPWDAQLIASGMPAVLNDVANKGAVLSVQYRSVEADSKLYSRYAECETLADMQAVNKDFRNDLTWQYKWVYPLTSFKTTGLAWGQGGGFDSPNMKSASFDMPNATNITGLCYNAYNLESANINAPNATVANSAFRWTRALSRISADLESVVNADDFVTYAAELTSFYSDMPNLTNGRAMFYKCSALEYCEIEVPALSNGDQMFDGCILESYSVICICESLPEYTTGTHKITLGIHVDYQADEEVITAIQLAESKGWTVTVQWNGTPRTEGEDGGRYGLRKPPVYAKVVEWQACDGRLRRELDWGQYVTNWEENGYQEFATVEEAREYFNMGEEV